jgi:hypothetical protein
MRAVALNNQQQQFAMLFVLDPETAGNGAASAAKSGYASPPQTACRLLRHPGVRAEVERLTRESLGDHAVAAADLLGRVIRDERAPLKLRIQAAQVCLDRAGFVPPNAPDSPPAPLDPADFRRMNLDELLAMLAVQEAKVEAMERNMIDVTPTTETVDLEAAAGSGPPAAG